MDFASEKIAKIVTAKLLAEPKSTNVAISGIDYTLVHHRPILVLENDIQYTESTSLSRNALFQLNLLLDNPANHPTHIILRENDKFHVFPVTYKL
jgi:hypothetical protein